jgi:hypothetical protein
MIRDGVPVSLLRNMHAFGKGLGQAFRTLVQKLSRRVAL